MWEGVGLSREEAEYLVNESLRLIVERQCPLGDLTLLAVPRIA
jgi:hypothetical protein